MIFNYQQVDHRQKLKLSVYKHNESLWKLLKSIEENIEIVLSASYEDLKTLSNLNPCNFEKTFKVDFLQRITTLANQVLLIKQEQIAISGIDNEKDKRKHEFPAPCQMIGKHT